MADFGPQIAQEARKRWAGLTLWPRVGLAFLAGLVVVAVLFTLKTSSIDWFGRTKARAEHAEVKAVNAIGTAAVATGQAAVAGDAAKIIERSTIRTETTHIIHEENADAIRRAPGAGVVLDPGLVDTVNRGLCRYEPESPACKLLDVSPALPSLDPDHG